MLHIICSFTALHRLTVPVGVVQTYVKFMARATGKDPAEVRKDMGRNRYFSATQVCAPSLLTPAPPLLPKLGLSCLLIDDVLLACKPGALYARLQALSPPP